MHSPHAACSTPWPHTAVVSGIQVPAPADGMSYCTSCPTLTGMQRTAARVAPNCPQDHLPGKHAGSFSICKCIQAQLLGPCPQKGACGLLAYWFRCRRRRAIGFLALVALTGPIGQQHI